MKVLDLFCGAGGAAMGLHRAWPDAEITGVDIVKQPHYPFSFLWGDALDTAETYLLQFDFIWASPICQGHSRTLTIREGHGDAKDWPDLVTPIREKLRNLRIPYVIENVHGAPLLRGSAMLCGTMFGLGVFRHRYFEANFGLLTPSHATHNGHTKSHRGYSKDTPFITVAGHNYNVAQGKKAMGIDWMSRDELSQAIPPAYSEFVAKQVPL